MDKTDQPTPHNPYDNGVRRLLALCAQDLLDWVTDKKARFTNALVEKLQSRSIEADAMHITT